MLQLLSAELEPVSVLGRNRVVAQGWGAGSSAGANWCCLILVNGTAFIYISEDLVLVCMFQSFIFSSLWADTEPSTGKCGGFITAYDITYATYSMHLSVQNMNSLYPGHSSTCSPKMTNSIVVCCDTALDSDSILGLFWMGFPMNTFSWKSLYFLYEWKQEAFWFSVLNYWHWSSFNCSNIQEVNFFTFILDFKL